MRKFIAIVFSCLGCLEPYAPPPSTQNLNALVVDGYIDANGTASVKLSRTIPLDGIDAPPIESGAAITIESSEGGIFSLHEDKPGNYSASGLSVTNTSTYSLHIVTSGKDEYRSDPMKMYPTPPIDSVYFTIDPAKGLEIRVDSHNDDPNSQRYYLFNGIETYEYHAAVYARYGLKNHVVYERTPEEQVFACYLDERTANVATSTHGLKEDRLTGIRLSIITRASPKISVRYSILVKEKAISQEEYTYQRLLLMTTEQQGSLFSQIPGAVVGNVHSTTNNDETVVGYFSAQQIQERRYFIDTRLDLPDGFYIKQFQANCQPEPTCGFPVSDQLAGSLGGCVYPTALSDGVGIVAYDMSQTTGFTTYMWTFGECSDCTLKGGTTTKPPFW
jgi:hypothetical protein